MSLGREIRSRAWLSVVLLILAAISGGESLSGTGSNYAQVGFVCGLSMDASGRSWCRTRTILVICRESIRPIWERARAVRSLATSTAHWGLEGDIGHDRNGFGSESTFSIGPRVMFRTPGMNLFLHSLLGVNEFNVQVAQHHQDRHRRDSGRRHGPSSLAESDHPRL